VTDEIADDPAPASPDHRQHQRLRDVVEPIDRYIDDAMPLFRAHSRKDRVVVDAGVVDQDLDGSFLEKLLESRARRVSVGQIELDGARLAAGTDDVGGYRLGGGHSAMCVHIDEVALGAQGSANGAADASTAAGDQRAGRDFIHILCRLPASSTTEARPLSKVLSRSRNANSYNAVRASPARWVTSQINPTQCRPIAARKAHVANRGKKSDLRRTGCACAGDAIGRASRQRAMKRHGLRGIFYTAGNAKSAV